MTPSAASAAIAPNLRRRHIAESLLFSCRLRARRKSRYPLQARRKLVVLLFEGFNPSLRIGLFAPHFVSRNAHNVPARRNLPFSYFRSMRAK